MALTTTTTEATAPATAPAPAPAPANGQSDLLLRAALRQPTEHVPVWMMRQAGRYLPEFRKAREGVDFFKMCQTPDLAATVTMQPLERFPVDAAIIFSDILVVPQAMGLQVEMLSGSGPSFPQPLTDPADMRQRLVFKPDVHAALGYVYQALQETKKRIGGRVPLIGFSGAPWTLMAYSVEGGGSKTFSKAKAWLFRHPEASHELLGAMSDVIIEYLVGQVKIGGAQALQVFDSWAGELGPETFRTFSLPYLERIARGVKAQLGEAAAVPMIVFAKGAHYALAELAGIGYDVVGIDWTVDPRAAREAVGGRVALQGNLDPCMLYGDAAFVRAEVRRMLEAFGTHGLIANLGHGLHPDHDPAIVAEFVAAVHDISKEINASR